MKPMILGIAGGTGSGKTTVAHSLLEALGPGVGLLLDVDAYYHDLKDLPLSERGQRNFDCPESIDFALLTEHIRQLRAGQPIDKPIYSFPEHVRLDRTQTVHPAPLIILEGILTLAHEPLLPLLDYKVYVEAPADIRFIRRLTRDIAERGRQVDWVIRQYLETVRPMHDLHIEPSRSRADLILPHAQLNPSAIHVLACFVRFRLGLPH
jgi:uridine kinase